MTIPTRQEQARAKLLNRAAPMSLAECQQILDAVTAAFAGEGLAPRYLMLLGHSAQWTGPQLLAAVSDPGLAAEMAVAGARALRQAAALRRLAKLLDAAGPRIELALTALPDGGAAARAAVATGSAGPSEPPFPLKRLSSRK